MRAILLAACLLATSACESAQAPSNADPCHPVPPSHCQADHDCFPFLCKSGLCEKACVSSATCAQGTVCNNEGKCVKAGTCNTCSGDYDCKLGMKCDLQSSSCK